MDRGAEITLEANPDDVTPAAVAAWRAAGVNRVSLGVQSFDPGVLRWMHRTHDARQVGRGGGAHPRRRHRRALPRPHLRAPRHRSTGTGPPIWITRSRSQPDHLSLYGLTVEAHTPLARWAARGEVHPVDEERYAAEFLAAHQALEGAGLRALRGVERRPGRPAGPAQLGVLAAGPVHRAGPLGPQRDRPTSGNGICGNGRRTSARLEDGSPVVAGEERLSPEEVAPGGALPRPPHRRRAAGRARSARDHRGLDRFRLGHGVRRAAPAHAGGLAPAGCARRRPSVGSRGHLPAGLRRSAGRSRRTRPCSGSSPSLSHSSAQRSQTAAHAGRCAVQLGAAHHEVGAGPADLGAIQEQADVGLVRLVRSPSPRKCRAAVSRQIRWQWVQFSMHCSISWVRGGRHSHSGRRRWGGVD